MKLVLVTGRPFWVFCIRCNQETLAGKDGDISRTAFADLDGEPFKAYYCARCAELAKQWCKGAQSSDGQAVDPNTGLSVTGETTPGCGRSPLNSPRNEQEPGTINQCDGCRAGHPLDDKGHHHVPGKIWDGMVCQKERYR